MWKQIALVALGGGAGSVLRYLVSVCSSRYFLPVFPWGTFIVNITGCFIIGLLIGLLSRFGSLMKSDLAYRMPYPLILVYE